MLRVVLTVDCERFISFAQGNPRWNRIERLKGKVNNLVKNFRYNSEGFEVVYNTLVQEKFPATLMVVGKLFKKIKTPKFIELGYHTENHLPLILIDDEKLKSEVKNKFGLKSLTAPMWMIEDKKDPERIFKVLKKQGYTHTVYRGLNDGINHFHYNSVEKPIEKSGITGVHVSNFFEGNWGKKKIIGVKRDILNNLDNEGVYLLTTHDFTHKNNKNLLEIIWFLKDLEKKRKIKMLKLKEIK